MLEYFNSLGGLLVYYLDEGFQACWSIITVWAGCWFTTLMKDSKHAGVL